MVRYKLQMDIAGLILVVSLDCVETQYQSVAVARVHDITRLRAGLPTYPDSTVSLVVNDANSSSND